MKLKCILLVGLIMVLCAISVETASAQNPPLQGIVWLHRESYNVGETVPIQYLVTRTASVTITVSGPSGTSNFNMGSVRGSAVLTFNGRAGQPGGWRTVTMRATASSSPRDQITARTSFFVRGQSSSPPPTFSAPA
jgi:hypothetical protein